MAAVEPSGHHAEMDDHDRSSSGSCSEVSTDLKTTAGLDGGMVSGHYMHIQSLLKYCFAVLLHLFKVWVKSEICV